MRQQGNKLYRTGLYLDAIHVYESGYEQAKQMGDSDAAVRFLNNLGSANYQIFRYRDAIRAYLLARDLANRRGDRESLGALCFNLSSLYYQMGNVEGAVELARQGLELPSGVTLKYRAKLLIQLALIRLDQNDAEHAIALLHEALEVSRDQLDPATESEAWSELGLALLNRGQLEAAERSLLESFRLRKLLHDDHLFYTIEALGRLHAARGDAAGAAVLFDRAIELGRTFGPSAVWKSYYERGRARLSQGRLQEAFDDFRVAVAYAGGWRAQALPADAFRVTAENQVYEAYSAYVELGSRLYRETGKPRFAEEAFEAAEESRAASLRALSTGPDLREKLPAEYWSTLSKLREADAAVLRRDTEADAPAVQSLRVRLTEMELRAGLAVPPYLAGSEWINGFVSKTRQALKPSEVFLSFHIGGSESCVWVVARDGFQLLPLPSRADLESEVAHFVALVRENSVEAAAAGQRLYSELLGGVPARLLNKPVWILAPDGPLFDLPFAALVETFHDLVPVYAIERHAIRLTPGLWALTGPPAPASDGPFVAVGDPIYNRADPRWQESGAPRERAAKLPARPMELARLLGSAREVEACANVWRSHGHQPLVLEGAAATREMIEAALRQNPSALHIAAHVLLPAGPAASGVIALSLQPGDQVDLLSATDIAGLRTAAGVVVIDGCNSGGAPSLPGTGLMGLTRAWLGAGAHAVIVTRWATSDQDDGNLFRSFYEKLAAAPRYPSFARLLQEAQIEAIHARGRRAQPSYWASYLCVERS